MHVIMFMDGTVRRTCMSCPNPLKLTPGITPYQCQRAQYSGHKHYHGFKQQALLSPSGMVVHMYGPVDGRRHDAFMLADSGLLPQLTGLSIDDIDYSCMHMYVKMGIRTYFSKWCRQDAKLDIQT